MAPRGVIASLVVAFACVANAGPVVFGRLPIDQEVRLVQLRRCGGTPRCSSCGFSTTRWSQRLRSDVEHSDASDSDDSGP
jgi:hypothetical protein